MNLNKPAMTQLELCKLMLNELIEHETDLIKRLTKSRGENLIASLEKAIQAKSPDEVTLVSFKFYKYLRYLDMGVGKGYKVGSRTAATEGLTGRSRAKVIAQLKRQKHPVHNRPVTAFTKRLGERLYELYGVKAITLFDDLTNKDATDINL